MRLAHVVNLVFEVFLIYWPTDQSSWCKTLVIGVFSDELCRPIAEVMKQLGAEHVMVVHSKDGLDEISLAAPTTIAELKDGEITEWTLILKMSELSHKH